MTTLGDLVNSIASSLHSFTGLQEVSTHLTSGVTSSALSFPVDLSDGIMRGIAEVDDELVYVNVSDSNVLTLAPYGRGYRGSTAATHAINAQVIMDPTFPRCEIRRAIDQVLLGLYPTLFQIKTVDLTYTSTPVGFSVPADCAKILDIKTRVSGDPLNYWAPIYNWSYDATSPEATGHAVNIFDNLPSGSLVRVVYQAPFGTFATTSDTLLSVGLKESWADIITYGVTSRMVRFLDPARLQLRAVENVTRSQFVAAGDAGKIANQLYAVFQQRLAEERRELLELTPARINFTR